MQKERTLATNKFVKWVYFLYLSTLIMGLLLPAKRKPFGSLPAISPPAGYGARPAPPLFAPLPGEPFSLRPRRPLSEGWRALSFTSPSSSSETYLAAAAESEAPCRRPDCSAGVVGALGARPSSWRSSGRGPWLASIVVRRSSSFALICHQKVEKIKSLKFDGKKIITKDICEPRGSSGTWAG